MNLIWFFLPGILYLGIKTSYTDIKYGKIWNKDVLAGIIYTLVLYLFISIYFTVRGQPLNLNYYLEFVVNAIFALFVAYGLWHYRIWSAGDGKLFFVFALMIPLTIYQYGRYNWVPSITLLVNIFLLGLVAMLFLIVLNAKLEYYKKTLKIFLKNFFTLKKLFQTAIALFAFFWVVQGFLSYIGFEQNILLRYILTIFLMSVSSRLLSRSRSKKKEGVSVEDYVFIFVGVIRCIVDSSVYSFNFWVSFLILVFIWRMLRGLMRHGIGILGKQIFAKSKSIQMLKPGMVLLDKVYKTKIPNDKIRKKLSENDVERSVNKNHLYVIGPSAGGKVFLDIEPEGITKSQIKVLKNIGFSHVRICKTTAFAPLMFASVLLTLLAKGNILILFNILF